MAAVPFASHGLQRARGERGDEIQMHRHRARVRPHLRRRAKSYGLGILDRPADRRADLVCAAAEAERGSASTPPRGGREAALDGSGRDAAASPFEARCARTSGREVALALPNPARVRRTMAWSSAARKPERSRGENGFGPPVISPAERSESISLRVASVMPIESAVKRLPFGAITSAPALTARLASGTSAVMTISPAPARSAIQLSASSMPAPTDDPLTISHARGTAIGAVADDEHLQRRALARMALGDAIHLLLHRAGIGVDVEGDRALIVSGKSSRPCWAPRHAKLDARSARLGGDRYDAMNNHAGLLAAGIFQRLLQAAQDVTR